MKNTKTHKIIMLPTEKSRLIYIGNFKKLHYMDYVPIGLDNDEIAQHLYIISDEQIKEGDWYINRFNQIHQASDINLTSQEEWNTCKKIVATTDNLQLNQDLTKCVADLVIENKVFLSQLPDSFISVYIKAYNEGKPITEIDLEMEQKYHIRGNNEYKDYLTRKEEKHCEWKKITRIKTREDNTVIVH